MPADFDHKGNVALASLIEQSEFKGAFAADLADLFGPDLAFKAPIPVIRILEAHAFSEEIWARRIRTTPIGRHFLLLILNVQLRGQYYKNWL